jgi:two-component system sensor histidine kinase UhpB
MKISTLNISLVLVFFLNLPTGAAQTQLIDSLKGKLATQKADTNKVFTLISLNNAYDFTYPDSALAYAKQALELAEKLDFEIGIFWAEIATSHTLMILGNYSLQLELAFKALSLAKKLNTPITLAYANAMLCGHYYFLGDYATAMSYWIEVIKIDERWFPDEMWGVWLNLSRIFLGLDKTDSAMFYANKAYEKAMINQLKYKDDSERAKQVGYTLIVLGNAFARKAEYDSALFFYRMGMPVSTQDNQDIVAVDGYNGIAAIHKSRGRLDSAIWYSNKVLNSKIKNSYPAGMLEAAYLLSEVYELNKMPDSTLKYFRMAVGLKDTLFNRIKMIAIQNLRYKETKKQQEIVDAKKRLQRQFIFYFLIAVAGSVFVIAGIVLKNRRQKQLQSIRNRIADDLHDDIGSTLSSIGIMSELAKKKSPEAHSLLTSIGESTLSLQENMSDIVWAIKSENDRFENLAQRMNRFASEMLDAKNIELDFIIDESLNTSALNMEKRKNIYLFFKEVINNAAKYSDAKNVFVSVSQKDHYAELKVTDNGKGFDTSMVSDGNGMNSLKQRASGIPADFYIKSELNLGTSVYLRFKIT